MTQPVTPPPTFDEFYVATRRRLLLQTFALTGDLAVSRLAVRDAYVAARQHWRKVEKQAAPEDWVRPRAWSIAQRRSAGRIWHREKGLTDGQRRVLEVLHKLPDSQRKVLLLTHLAALSLTDIGREIGETRSSTERLLQQATASTSLGLDCNSALLRGQIESLAPLVAQPGLPRASVIRRSGKARRRRHAALGAVAAVAVVLGSGAFVSGKGAPGEKRTPAGPTAHPVTAAMLLNDASLAVLKPHQTWRIVSTDDNTSGQGINSVCQGSRFADPRGVRSFVRKFVSVGKPRRSLVQTVEISDSNGAALRAYATTSGWYSGCSAARVQLQRAYRVSNVGDRAQAFKLRVPGAQGATNVVAVATSGNLTTSTILQTAGRQVVSADQLAGVLSHSMRNLCASDEIVQCMAGIPAVRPVLPPRSTEAPGFLAVTDLPPLGTITRPWVGTDPGPGNPNLAATTCDQTNFAKSGAASPVSRTFLIPKAKVPRRFGITETRGTFASPAAARKFATRIVERMRGCEKRQLGSKVTDEFLDTAAYRRSLVATWRIDNEINDQRKTVGYWMGIAVVGRTAIQVTLAPGPGADLVTDQFRDLVSRARDRLFELPQ